MASKTTTAEKVNGRTTAAKKGRPKAKAVARIVIPKLAIDVVHIPIVSLTPLITNRWSEKAKEMMRKKQGMKAGATARTPKDPEQCFEDAKYKLDDGRYGFPAIAFKQAAVRAAKGCGMAMTDARAAFHVVGEFNQQGEELVAIDTGGVEPINREDVVRVANGNADLRYRPFFANWSALVQVEYNKAMISDEQLVNLFNHAGFGTGIGEGRPEKNMNFGRYTIAFEDVE